MGAVVGRRPQRQVALRRSHRQALLVVRALAGEHAHLVAPPAPDALRVHLVVPLAARPVALPRAARAAQAGAARAEPGPRQAPRWPRLPATQLVKDRPSPSAEETATSSLLDLRSEGPSGRPAAASWGQEPNSAATICTQHEGLEAHRLLKKRLLLHQRLLHHSGLQVLLHARLKQLLHARLLQSELLHARLHCELLQARLDC